MVSVFSVSIFSCISYISQIAKNYILRLLLNIIFAFVITERDHFTTSARLSMLHGGQLYFCTLRVVRLSTPVWRTVSVSTTQYCLSTSFGKLFAALLFLFGVDFHILYFSSFYLFEVSCRSRSYLDVF